VLSKSGSRTVAAIALLCTTVAGCSDTYFDRRDSVSLSAGDAIATNKVTQVIDPWPVYSGNTRIAYSGQRTQAGMDRYNRGKVITPVLPTTTSKEYLAIQQQAAATASATAQATSATPAAAVKGPGTP
jgi:hypothetical protein